MKLTGKDVLAILISLLSLAGLAVMFMAEGQVVLDVPAGTALDVVRQEFNTKVLPGVVQYALAFGLILLATSLAYIVLVGREEDIKTRADE